MASKKASTTESLRQRVVAGIHLGILNTGDRLPSVREVSTEFGVNPRAVMAAYRQLADEGLVRLRRRSGAFVAAQAAPEEPPLPIVAAWLVDMFVRGLSRDISPAELRHQALACLDTIRLRVACLECNDDQIHALGEQVRQDYGFDAVAVDTEAFGPGRPLPPRVASADLVLTTRFHEIEARRLGKRLRVPVVVATLDPVFVSEVRRLLAAGRVWWICTDPRFAAKLPRMFPGAPVTPVVLGRRPPEGIPAEDLVYATRSAAARLPDGWRGGRVVTVQRVFSIDTARALIAFLMRRNLAAGNRKGRIRRP